MKCIFKTRQDVVCDEEGKQFITYGVNVVSGEGQVLQSIPDIFLGKQEAYQFVNCCNKNELQIIHLLDVIEDVLL